MVKRLGLTREDSAEIGFVLASLFASAIDTSELQEWSLMLLENHKLDELPPYVIELAEFDGPLAKVYNLISFVPSWGGTEDDRAALLGIAVSVSVIDTNGR